MTSTDLQILVLQTSAGAMEFAVNWFIQSSLLIVVGIAIARLFRRHGSAVQSVVYRTTLVAVLVCPLATIALSNLGISGWSIQLPTGFEYRPMENPILSAAPDVNGLPGAVASLGDGQNVSATAVPSGIEYPPQESVVMQGAASADAIAGAIANAPIGTPPEVADSSTESTKTTLLSEMWLLDVQLYGIAAIGILMVWMFVGTLFLWRLAAAWRSLGRLRRGATGVEPDIIDACQSIAGQMGVIAPEVLRTPYLPSPCLAGIRRPAVLLPEFQCEPNSLASGLASSEVGPGGPQLAPSAQEDCLSLRDILVHELAHLRRHDCHWNLLRRLATAIFFFQPLLWWLSRLVESTAEEVCDDHVVQFGGDRSEYANRLVDVAELCTVPAAPAGVGIVSVRSMLAKRVERIMDKSRTLSTRIGNLLLVLVIIGGLIGTTAVGLVGLESSAQPAVEDPGFEDNIAPNESDEDIVSVSGLVVNPKGASVDGATVRVVHWIRNPEPHGVQISQTKSDADGKFTVRYSRSLFDSESERHRAEQKIAIIAVKDGYGPEWVWHTSTTDHGSVQLRLPVDDRPIKGRALDLEGRPIAGVRVKVSRYDAPRADDLTDWIANVRNGATPWFSADQFRGSIPVIGTGIQPSVVTDQEGRFTIAGVGQERKINLTFEGSSVARTEATVVTRDIAPMSQSLTTLKKWAGDRKHHIFGSKFEITLPPTRVIEGIVRDAESGQAMAGVGVASWRFSGTHTIGERHIRTVTDEHGRYRLVGMPKGAGNKIVAIPNDEQPYLMRVAEVPDEPGMSPQNVDIDLHRGIWITGRATNKKTGKPICNARLYYLPFLTNEFAQANPSFHSNLSVDGTIAYQDRYQTSKDGTYRLVGLSGRAIVAIQDTSGRFLRGRGADEIEGINKFGNFETYRNPVWPGHHWPSSMKEIEPAKGTDSINVNLELDPGNEIKIDLLDNHGRPLSGVNVIGMRSNGYGFAIDSSSFQVTALGSKEKRTILLHHQAKNLGRVIRVTGQQGQSVSAELQPCAKVVGRLTDANNEPVRSAEVRFSVLPNKNFGNSLSRVFTDDEGTFEQPSVLAGASYQVSVESTQTGYRTITKSLKVSPGELIDLGTIDVTSDERPEPVRTAATTEETVAQTGNPLNPDTENGLEENRVSNEASRDVSNVETSTESDDDASVTTFAGTVVDPNGKPVDGAELHFVFQQRQRTGLLEPTSRPVAVTNQDGIFRFTAKPEQFRLSATNTTLGFSWLVAVKPGYGFAWSNADIFDADGKLQAELRKRLNGLPEDLKVYFSQDLGFNQGLDNDDKTLRLVKDDVPIRGRIVDTEGRGVAGAKLTLLHVSSSLTDNLDAWREAAAVPGADFSTARMKTNYMMYGPQVRSLVKPATTDSDGRFTISGVGRDRICELLLTAPRIESTKLLVRTESGEPIPLARHPSSQDPRKFIYFPAEFSHVAGPSTPIVGVVRDSVSQAPLAGITIKSQKRDGDKSWGEDFVRAVTDEQGNYRLDGMPVGEDNYIAAIAPDGDVAYLSSRKQSATEIDQERLEVDFDLPRGVWVSGRITDFATKKGLAGWFEYLASKTNPHRRLIGPTARGGRFNSNADGQFRIAVSPGPGHVMFTAAKVLEYPRAKSVYKFKEEKKNGKDQVTQIEPPMFIQNYHLVAEINPQEGSDNLTLDLQLDGRKRLSGRVVDADGNRISDYYYTDRLEGFGVWNSPIAGKFELLGYNPKKMRHIYFLTPDHRLAGYLTVTGQVSGELVVRLKPSGRVKGRLIDSDGGPLGDHLLDRWYSQRDPLDESTQYVQPPLPRNIPSERAGRYETDSDGNFEITGLVPDVEYRIRAKRWEEGKRSMSIGPLDVVIQVGPGETKDLGDVRIADPKKFKADAFGTMSPRADSAKQSLTKIETTFDVTGRVTDSKNSPVSGAYVAVVARNTGERRGGDLTPQGEVLAEGTTDRNGRFNLCVKNASSKTHDHPRLIARRNGDAIGWTGLNLDNGRIETTIRLENEQPIVGKLVDIEGRPIVGAKLSVRRVGKPSKSVWDNRDRVAFAGRRIPKAWLPSLESDAKGEFVVHGIPKGCGISIHVAGSDRNAPQSIALNTGQPEQRSARDHTYRALVKNVPSGETAVFPLAPPQIFEGVVTYQDTGDPAPHARLTVWTSQQREFGSMVPVAGIADAGGRYRINPRPGIRFRVTAYPPDGTAYLPRKTPRDEDIRWTSGDRIKQVDMALPRGVLIHGKVIDDQTLAPVKVASVQYVPERSNNPNTADDILTGWQWIQQTNSEGAFTIAVLPGRGRLLVYGPSGRFVSKTISARAS